MTGRALLSNWSRAPSQLEREKNEEELSAPPGQDGEEYVKIKDKTEATFLYFHIFSECPQQVQNCSILWAGQMNAGFERELV